LVAKDRKRRIWSDDEKRMICAQTRVAGVSVSQVARRYDANANLVFAWLRDPRFADSGTVDAARFLPVEIVAEVKAPPASPVAENWIEIDLAGGHRMRISGSYDPEALARLIRGLSA
jgi:transposase